MGFSVGAAQCLIAPPYAFAAIITYITGYLGDKYKLRGPVICFNMLLCLIGLPIMGFHKKAAVRYFGVFLTTAGANSNVPAAMSYQANNIRGQWKRAFCSATLVGFGGIGGIAGGLVFRSQDEPHYRPGLYACIACCLLTLVIVGIETLIFVRQNGRAARGEIELEDSSVSVLESDSGCGRLTFVKGGSSKGLQVHLLGVSHDWDVRLSPSLRRRADSIIKASSSTIAIVCETECESFLRDFGCRGALVNHCATGVARRPTDRRCCLKLEQWGAETI